MKQYQKTLQAKGYENLAEYLEDVADTYGAELLSVEHLAALLGPDELFDGLLSEVADMVGSPFMEVTKQ